MNLRQAKSTLLIFTYIFVMFLLPTISFHLLATFCTNDVDIQVFANLISYIVLVIVSIAFFGRELAEQFKKITSIKHFIKGVAVVVEDFSYGCKSFPTFGINDKDIPNKIKEILSTFVPL